MEVQRICYKEYITEGLTPHHLFPYKYGGHQVRIVGDSEIKGKQFFMEG